MSDEALTDIANAMMRLRAAFRKHRLEVPVRVELKDEREMINLAMMLRASTRFDYSTDLDAPRQGGRVTVNVCGIEIAAQAGHEMRRVSSIMFHERLPLTDDAAQAGSVAKP